MEKNRIYNAASGCILIILFLASVSIAQDVSARISKDSGTDEVSSDSSRTESKADSLRKITEGIFEKKKSDFVADSTDTLIAADISEIPDTLHEETISPTAYYRRDYLSKGIGDELKGQPGIFVRSPGPVGSPQIPLQYLNVAGFEIYLNEHPFLYNDIYRPYVIGSDLNAVPWEILNEIHWNDKHSLDNRIHIDLGRPTDNENRSDIEVARGPYGYNSSRWRFFRPFGYKTYGYFTVGFKKSNGFLQNTAYDGYHVTGGGSRVVYDGLLSVNLWKYRAKTGLNSFEYLTPQTFRHSRTTHRYEASYFREMGTYFDLTFSGVYQKNGVITKDITDTLSIDQDIGGVKISIGKKIKDNNLELGIDYYRIRTYGLAGVKPAVNLFDYFGKVSGEIKDLDYRIDLKYSWNGFDHGALLPSGYVKYNINRLFNPFASLSRSRRLPDLNLAYFNDTVGGLGVSNILQSYSFESSPYLRYPVTSDAMAGIEGDFGWSKWKISASYIKIKDQIYLSYRSDTLGNVTVSPVNFDDELIEITGVMNLRYGIFDGQFGGAFRKWKERYFSDGLEKGPAVIGFGRLSASKSFFFDDLFLGGSLEFRAASRQDYRSIRPAYLDGFGVLNGRFEFRYKDFIFWWNDDNLTNNNYTTWWPYPETPRTLWWGFRWRFYD